MRFPKYFPVGVPAGVMAAGDVNGDGKMDIVVTRAANMGVEQTSPIPYDASVLVGRGDGTFLPAKNYHLLGYPSQGTLDIFNDEALFLIDVNKDGKLDLLGDWGVALGNGDGSFKSPVSLPSGLHIVNSIAEGDFNHDGNVDLEIATLDRIGGTTSLSTLLGNGKGTFTIAHTIPFNEPGFPDSDIIAVAAADLNGDGLADLLYTGSVHNDTANNGIGFYVQLGRGDGTFKPAVKYPGVGGYNILAADFNRDGLPDVLLTSFSYLGDLVLFKGIGKGLLGMTPERFSTGISGSVGVPLVSVNLNGDTALDLAALVVNGFARVINTGVH
jgi:hypothetical protein